MSTVKDTQVAITSPNISGSIGTTGGGGCGSDSQELVSLSGEYGKHLSNVVINNINHIHILLYNLIPLNLSYLSFTLSKIRSLIKFSINILHQALNNISSVNNLSNNICKLGISGSQNCLDQIKSQLTQLQTILPNLYDSYGYINYLRIEAERIINFDRDVSGPNSKISRLIQAFICSLSEFATIETLLNSAKSIIYEITTAKDQLINSTNQITNQEFNSVYLKITCCCDAIDGICSAIKDLEFYTLCLKYWICKFINLDISKNLLNRFLFTDKILDTDIDEICQPIKCLYSCVSEIFNICDPKCQCNCKCDSKCNGNFICLCLCNSKDTASNGFCICICKKQEDKNSCKCICICLCNKPGDTCGCQTGQTHNCDKCLVKIDIGTLKDQTLRIDFHLAKIRSFKNLIEKKCCPCSCCENGISFYLCCSTCKKNIYYYKSIRFSVNNIEYLLNQIRTKIPQLLKLKNILSIYPKKANSCESCGCKDKIASLIYITQKSIRYYKSFTYRIQRIKYFFDDKFNYRNSKQIICSIESSVRSFIKHLGLINYHIVKINNGFNNKGMTLVPSNTLKYINTISRKNIFIITSKIIILEFQSLSYKLSKYFYRSSDIVEILSSGIRPCCCICSFRYNLRCRKFKFTEFPDEYHRTVDHHLRFYLRSTADNRGNNLCLCLVTKYLLIRNVRTLMCYMRDIVGDLYSSVSRRFDKYTHSTGYMFSVGKLIMMIISVIYKVTLWMKFKYLCTCPPGCPCCRQRHGSPCSCNCEVCKQPPVQCCTCPPKTDNCTNNNNTCCCKCKNANGTLCCNCRSCNSGKCCRCCCNCFCKNYDDPYYPYLISIILFISSLIENIWTMDSESVRMSIDNISSLLSEYQSLHVYTNYYSPSSYDLSTFMSSKLSKNTTIYENLSRKQIKVVEGSVKSWICLLKRIILRTYISKERLTLIYGKYSRMLFYTQNSNVITKGRMRSMKILGMEISLDYLDKICTEECNQTCCLKNGMCKICPITKIKIGCLCISLKRIKVVLPNVSADMLLNYLIGSINISEDFVTNLCVGFGEVYAIMLKNQPISSSGYSNLRNYGRNKGVKDESTSNWGYDTRYEHQINTLCTNNMSDNYPLVC